jgi:hypothetical protein
MHSQPAISIWCFLSTLFLSLKPSIINTSAFNPISLFQLCFTASSFEWFYPSSVKIRPNGDDLNLEMYTVNLNFFSFLLHIGTLACLVSILTLKATIALANKRPIGYD